MRSSDKSNNKITIITLMGVSGCGKTTIGEKLAAKLKWEFIESDQFHSPEDIEKMSNGTPLTDTDRWPWLRRLHKLLVMKQRQGISVILACSALKSSYRNLLYDGLHSREFVYLRGSYDLILKRMRKRAHFMKPEMLQSQFDALEEPQNALFVDIQDQVDEIVAQIINEFSLL